MDELRLRRLLDVARAIMAELDPDVVLDRLLELAQELTGARYAAIGVLDERREMLDQFLTKGIDEQTHRAIGDLPHGRGVLGVLIRDPRPLRLADVGAHPESYGFPLSHPKMRSFLGVPIAVRGEVWGNLYLTEKEGGEFTQDDEDAVVILAGWAAIAINNARLYRDVRQRRDELQRANRGLETTTEITRALGGVTDVDRVLELVAKRSRALIDARVVELALLEGDELVLAAGAGEGVQELLGERLPVDASVAGMVFRSGRSLRLSELPADSFARRMLGARTALVTPMIFHNRAIGILSAFDRTAATARSPRRTSGSCRRSPRAPPPPSRLRRPRPTTLFGAACTPPSRNAGAGPASCTTRPCRSWGASRCCCPARAAARTRRDSGRRWTRRST